MSKNIWTAPQSDLQQEHDINLCPHCFEPMIKGYILSSSSIDWIDETNKVKSFKIAQGERLSAKGLVLTSAKVYGHRCRSCRITIIED